jgi:hypothetical protein
MPSRIQPVTSRHEAGVFPHQVIVESVTYGCLPEHELTQKRPGPLGVIGGLCDAGPC